MLTDTRSLRRILFSFAALVLAVLAGGASASASSGGPSGGVTGILQIRATAPGEEPQLLEGVDVVASSAELSPDGRTIVSVGDEVGRATTGADGAFLIELPTPGDYVVEIDESTLPEGVSLANPLRAQLAARLGAGQTRNLLFALTEGAPAATGTDSGTTTTTPTTPGATAARTGDSAWTRLARMTYEGIQFGLIIGMCAIGLSLIFATTGLVNFAHGEMITLGGVLAYVLNDAGLHLLIAAPIAVVLGGVLGSGVDFGLWRPLRARGVGLVSMMVISIGMSIALRYLILYWFGDRSRPYRQYALQTDALFTVGAIRVLPKDLFIIVTSTLLLVGVGLLLKMTKLGKAMRAISDNRDLAAATGIDVGRIITLVWFMAGALVTVGGIFLGLTELNQWEMGTTLLLLVFAAVTLGGLGTTYGAMIGSLVIGIAISVATVPKLGSVEVIEPATKNAAALLVMIVILMVRPQGIFGQRERIG